MGPESCVSVSSGWNRLVPDFPLAYRFNSHSLVFISPFDFAVPICLVHGCNQAKLCVSGCLKSVTQRPIDSQGRVCF